jgi:hypothetical protein
MRMFLIRCGQFLVFVQRDPRPGCSLDVESDIALDQVRTSYRETGHELCVGVDPSNPRHYGIFQSLPCRARAGFRQVVGIPVVARTWLDFLNAASDCGEVLDAAETIIDERRSGGSHFDEQSARAYSSYSL